MTLVKSGDPAILLGMRAKQRRFRVPFVVTATLAGVPLACGGETDSQSTGSGGSVSTGGSGATGGNATGGSGATGGYGATGGSAGVGGYGATGGGAGAGGSGAVGGSAGAGGSGGNVGCPPDPPSAFATCAQGTTCKYDIACQSGKQTFTYVCQGATYQAWAINAKSCDPTKPYDSCPKTDLYCGTGGWSIPQGTNPPSPCPETAPLAGATCYAGGFGGVWENCGYPCKTASGSGWTVMKCSYNPDGGPSSWEVGTACK